VSDVDAINRRLRLLTEAAGVLARSAGHVWADAPGPDASLTTIQAARTTVAQLRIQVQRLLDRLDETSHWLSAWEEAALAARDFDPRTWPERRDALAARLAADQAAGAADWLAAWARAFLLGCPAEADRLATEPFKLPPEAA